MKYQKKSLVVLALAGLMTVLMAGECGPEGGTNAGGGDQFDYDTVKAKMWKNLDKSAFDNGTVTQVVVSGKNTYVATSDKGLFLEQADGTFKKVDLGKGTAPAGGAAIAEAGLNIRLLTALSGDRVIFGVNDGAHSIIIAEGDAAKVNWAPAGGLGGNTVTSLLAATGGANNKEHIFAANNTHEIFMQLDSAAPVNAWDVTLADAAGNAFNHGGAATTIHDLYLNHDGSALVFSKTNLHGYDTIAKANWNAAGHAASNVGAISIGGRAGQPVWTNANEPANIVFTAVDKAVFNIALNVGSATNLTPAAAVNVAVVLNPVPTAIYKLAKDGTKVEVFTKEGLFSVDGPNATVASPFTGDNYMDEGKKPADLESMKKADLKAADLGTKDIKDMAMSKTTTYYVTDKGLSVGKEATLKLNKRKKA